MFHCATLRYLRSTPPKKKLSQARMHQRRISTPPYTNLFLTDFWVAKGVSPMSTIQAHEKKMIVIAILRGSSHLCLFLKLLVHRLDSCHIGNLQSKSKIFATLLYNITRCVRKVKNSTTANGDDCLTHPTLSIWFNVLDSAVMQAFQE